MDEIIKKAYIRLYGERPYHGYHFSSTWNWEFVAFKVGWGACEEWQAEQDAREKDDKQEQEDLEHLYRGDF